MKIISPIHNQVKKVKQGEKSEEKGKKAEIVKKKIKKISDFSTTGLVLNRNVILMIRILFVLNIK